MVLWSWKNFRRFFDSPVQQFSPSPQEVVYFAPQSPWPSREWYQELHWSFQLQRPDVIEDHSRNGVHSKLDLIGPHAVHWQNWTVSVQNLPRRYGTFFFIKLILKCPYCNFVPVHLSDIIKLQTIMQLQGLFLLNVTRQESALNITLSVNYLRCL